MGSGGLKTTKMTAEIDQKRGDKSFRGNASQFFVAGELCRRGLVAVVTLGNTPNTDILCSNRSGTAFVHIQVKTFVPGNPTVSVGQKAERDYGSNFVWVLAGIPHPITDDEFVYYIIPSAEVAKHVSKSHRQWLAGSGAKGRIRKDSTVRTIHIPPKVSNIGWDISSYKNRWDIIENLLT
jgi:hypothetical protein